MCGKSEEKKSRVWTLGTLAFWMYLSGPPLQEDREARPKREKMVHLPGQGFPSNMDDRAWEQCALGEGIFQKHFEGRRDPGVRLAVCVRWKSDGRRRRLGQSRGESYQVLNSILCNSEPYSPYLMPSHPYLIFQESCSRFFLNIFFAGWNSRSVGKSC